MSLCLGGQLSRRGRCFCLLHLLVDLNRRSFPNAFRRCATCIPGRQANSNLTGIQYTSTNRERFARGCRTESPDRKALEVLKRGIDIDLDKAHLLVQIARAEEIIPRYKHALRDEFLSISIQKYRVSYAERPWLQPLPSASSTRRRGPLSPTPYTTPRQGWEISCHCHVRARRQLFKTG